MSSPYSCVEEPVRKHGQDCFGENARIRHVAFIEKGVVIDKSTPAKYIASLLAAEAACNGFILRNVNGTYDGGAATMGKGRGDEPERVVGRQHGAAFTDFEYVSNEDFWDSMTKRSKNYNAHLITSSRGWAVEGNNISIDPKAPITDDVKAEIEGNIDLKWSNNGVLKSYPIDPAPLQNPAELIFGGLSESGVGNETINKNRITVAQGGTISVDVQINGAEEFLVTDEAALPNWLAVGETGRLEGVAPNAAQLASFTVRGVNACGLAKDVPLVIEVTA